MSENNSVIVVSQNTKSIRLFCGPWTYDIVRPRHGGRFGTRNAGDPATWLREITARWGDGSFLDSRTMCHLGTHLPTPVRSKTLIDLATPVILAHAAMMDAIRRANTPPEKEQP